MTPGDWFVYGPLGGMVAVLLGAVAALWKAREADRSEYTKLTAEMTAAVREVNVTLKTVVERMNVAQQIQEAIRAAREGR